MGQQVTNPSGADLAILIPVDFSSVCENAMVHGLEIARRISCEICLLHVCKPAAGDSPNEKDPSREEICQALFKYKEKYEQKYAVTINLILRDGNLFKVVNETVAEFRPRLMVMGTHGKQGLQHLFGSHALRVVLDSPCPVLVVQNRPFEKGYRNVLLAVNSLTEPIEAIAWLLFLHKVCAPGFHIFHPLETSPDREKKTSGIVSRIAAALKEHQIPHTIGTASSSADFSGQVIDFAIVTCSDLIITMTLPATDASGFSFSDWNERLMFNTHQVPVMFIDRPDDAG